MFKGTKFSLHNRKNFWACNNIIVKSEIYVRNYSPNTINNILGKNGSKYSPKYSQIIPFFLIFELSTITLMNIKHSHISCNQGVKEIS